MKRLFAFLLALFLASSCTFTPAFAEDGLSVLTYTTEELVLNKGLTTWYWPYFPAKERLTHGDVQAVREHLDWIIEHTRQARDRLECGEYEIAINQLWVITGYTESAVHLLAIEKPR